MAWLDFLFGPPNRDSFAKLVMTELQRKGKSQTLKYDADKFMIERADEGFVNLANLYHEYCQTPRGQRTNQHVSKSTSPMRPPAPGVSSPPCGSVP